MPDIISGSDLSEKHNLDLPGYRLGWLAIYEDGSNLFQYQGLIDGSGKGLTFFEINFPMLRELALVDTANKNKLVIGFKLPTPFPKARPIYRRRVKEFDKNKRSCIQVLGWQQDIGERGKEQEVLFFDDKTAKQIGELNHGWEPSGSPGYELFGAPYWYEHEVAWGMVTIINGQEDAWRSGMYVENDVGSYRGVDSSGLRPGGVLKPKQ